MQVSKSFACKFQKYICVAHVFLDSQWLAGGIAACRRALGATMGLPHVACLALSPLASRVYPLTTSPLSCLCPYEICILVTLYSSNF
jgi:hypothetical protein